MLTIEEIKQAVEFADGFEYFDDFQRIGARIIYLYKVAIRLDDIVEWDYYDLFLDRVIQGINRGLNDIVQYNGTIEANGIDFDHNGSTEGIRESREDTIRFVLIEGY